MKECSFKLCTWLSVFWVGQITSKASLNTFNPYRSSDSGSSWIIQSMIRISKQIPCGWWSYRLLCKWQYDSGCISWSFAFFLFLSVQGKNNKLEKTRDTYQVPKRVPGEVAVDTVLPKLPKLVHTKPVCNGSNLPHPAIWQKWNIKLNLLLTHRHGVSHSRA